MYLASVPKTQAPAPEKAAKAHLRPFLALAYAAEQGIEISHRHFAVLTPAVLNLTHGSHSSRR